MEIEGGEAYDLIITDYELPDMNGVALARAARTAAATASANADHHVHGQYRRA